MLLQRIKGFNDLVRILSTMCRICAEPDDQMSFNAAVCLGRLCCPDDNARARLKLVVDDSHDSHMRAEVCHTTTH